MAGIVFSGISPRQPRWPCLSNDSSADKEVLKVFYFDWSFFYLKNRPIKINKQNVAVIFIDEGI